MKEQHSDKTVKENLKKMEAVRQARDEKKLVKIMFLAAIIGILACFALPLFMGE